MNEVAPLTKDHIEPPNRSISDWLLFALRERFRDLKFKGGFFDYGWQIGITVEIFRDNKRIRHGFRAPVLSGEYADYYKQFVISYAILYFSLWLAGLE